MAEVNVSKDIAGRIIVSFPYNPLWIKKIKTVPRHRCHPDEKHWSFPDTDGTFEQILKVFEGEEIHIDPALQVFTPVIARPERLKQSQDTIQIPSLAKRGEGRFSDKNLPYAYLFCWIAGGRSGKVKTRRY